jgi:hypothetical protein
MQRMIAALAIGLLTCSRVTADDAGEKTGVPAISADTFLSSLGVNTHVDQGYNAGSYVVPLRYLGVRNIRDSARNLFSSRPRASYPAMSTSAGTIALI